MRFILFFFALAAFSQTQVSRPAVGPSGYDYKHGVTISGPFWPVGSESNDALRYYIYHPKAPVPEFAPVLAFFHGLDATDPVTYEKWLVHVAQKGYTVVWLQFQIVGTTALADFKTNAVTSFAAALTRIAAGGYPPPLKSGTVIQTAYFGHSAGSATAVSVASLAVSGGLIPVPKAHFASNPGLDTSPPSLAGIPASFRIIILVGDEDDLVCKVGASTLWTGLAHVTDKQFMVQVSDNYGSVGSRISSNHIFPTTAIITAQDYHSVWKLTVGLMNCVMRGTDCQYATGGGADQTFMGRWSDGVAIAPMVIYASPASVMLTCE